jgi:phosphoglycolate phosphatase
MMGSPSIGAVLFDLDGTLLDTLEDLAASMNRVLAAHGWPPRRLDEYRYFVGRGVEELVRSAVPPETEPGAIDGLVAEMAREYRQGWALRTRPYPQIPELLDALSAGGLKLAVLSNKLEECTLRMVAHFLSRWRFAAVVGASARFPRKPDPAAALAIAAQLDLRPEEFLYLGDTSIDVCTALAAGMHPVGVLWGFRGADELRGAGARHLIGRPLDLLPLLAAGYRAR